MRCVSGMLFEYYHICRRKVWYTANGISLEAENEDVQIGKLIDSGSYDREKKHIMIDDRACIDFMRDSTVYEIKKSSAQKESAIAQIKYYLYVLRQKGVEVTGELRVPAEKYTEKVELGAEDVQSIEEELLAIEELITSENAPERIANTGVCRKCAFYELCYI